ncbi:radical SAM protein [Clostridium sp. D2Q-14]|uniref:B12-binding domain-containing radical SAM protein n=1 Tax=Anaeromonas gelatinilytica TaxID=2683194 RepID=UPI00193B32B2|nr:radical SAM protein [Anaeromonas gelatinilytica]MBS4535036.1 radical SAM protein [Anaeromonas gelatinilytica]
MIVLINAPQWTSNMPPIALPVLAGYIRNQNIDCNMLDINILFYDKILSKDILNNCITEINKTRYSSLSDKEKNTLLVSNFTIENIENAKSILNDRNAVFDKNKYLFAERIICNAYEIFSIYTSPISIHNNSMNFDKEFKEFDQILEYIEDCEAVKILEGYYEDIITCELDTKVRLVGFSINNIAQLINSIIISKLIKRKYNVHITFGGAFLSANSSELIKWNKLFDIIDSIILYDGEHALVSLYNKIINNEDYSSNLNTIIKNDNKIIQSPNLIVESLDDLPSPDYDGLPMEKYLSPELLISLPVSRGCYGNCSFCGYKNNYSAKWREESVDIAIKKIKALKQKYNSRYFFFSVATMSPKMARELSSQIIEENLNIIWSTGIRMEKGFDKETIQLMSESGCMRVDIGVESSNQRVLNMMNKFTKIGHYDEIMNNMQLYGILPYIYIIRDFPTETIKEWNDTLIFLNKWKDSILGFAYYDFILNCNTDVMEKPNDFNIVIIDKYDNDKACYINNVAFKVNGDEKKIHREYKDKLTKEFLFNLSSFDILENNVLNKAYHKFLIGQYIQIEENRYFNEENKIRVSLNCSYNIGKNIDVIKSGKNYILLNCETAKRITVTSVLYSIITSGINIKENFNMTNEVEEKLFKSLNILFNDEYIYIK